MTEGLVELCSRCFGVQPDSITSLRAHASDRKLFRLLVQGQSVIGVIHNCLAENQAFIGFSKFFKSCGLAVPEIYAVSDDQLQYLEQDLGDLSLYDLLQQKRTSEDVFPEAIEALYQKALTALIEFQIEGCRGLDGSLFYQGKVFDGSAMLQDMYAFRDDFVEAVGIRFDSVALEQDFMTLAHYNATVDHHHFMYRDFQARNIMVLSEGQDKAQYLDHQRHLAFIDYQTGREGPIHYDVASILYQSQAGIPNAARRRLLNHYLSDLQNYLAFDPEEFIRQYYGLVYMRLLQVFGVYGRLGLGQGKAYFLKGIPALIDNIALLYDEVGLPVACPELEHVLERIRIYNQETRCL